MSGENEEKKLERPVVASAIKWLLLTVVGTVIGWAAFCEARKAYWDGQVRKMCEKDGRITVSQRVLLSSEAERKKLFPLPYKGDVVLEAPYFIESLQDNLRIAAPKVWRSDTRIVRSSNKKILASKIEYGRSGGDFLTIDHPSIFIALTPATKKFTNGRFR